MMPIAGGRRGIRTLCMLAIALRARAWSVDAANKKRVCPPFQQQQLARFRATVEHRRWAATDDDDDESAKEQTDEQQFSQINGDVPSWQQRQAEKRRREQELQTGWNHKQPERWRRVRGGGGETFDNDTPSSLSSRDLPTGWLHNSQSKEERQTQDAAASTTPSTAKPGGGARLLLERAMVQQARQHRILAVTFHAVGERQIVVTEHKLLVPLRHDDDQNSDKLDLYFTIVETCDSDQDRRWFETLRQQRTPLQRGLDYVEHAAMHNADNMVLYLQGGPGFGAPAPVARLTLSKDGSWAAAALDHYSRVVLMDQRGTGRSSPITKQTLEHLFPDLFVLDRYYDTTNGDATLASMLADHPKEHAKVSTAVQQVADYLACFRSDNIVRDAEIIRAALLLPSEDEATARPWGCSLGQSFGGFCQMSYLSVIKHPPQRVLLTAGIAPMLTTSLVDVYKSLWGKVRERNTMYYDMYPGDVALVKRIVRRLWQRSAPLPSGGTLTARRFLQLGLSLGGSPANFSNLHVLLSSAFVRDGHDELSRAFLKEVDHSHAFDEAPLYYWLQEACYANGADASPTQWAAERALADLVAVEPLVWDYTQTCLNDSDDIPVMFYGEMVFSWMAQDFAELRGIGLQALMQALADKDDWGALYNADAMRDVLASGKSKVAAVVYHGDMYVDFDCSMQVLGPGGPLDKAKTWITNDYQHSGLRDDGANIFNKLTQMVKGQRRNPS